jgi:tRNA A-37 threonylcarbamoyl transferase component Bud32
MFLRRRRVYNALTELHTAKVLHIDFVPRNVLRRNDGSFFVTDFGNASVDHLCPGTDCGELKQLREALEI